MIKNNIPNTLAINQLTSRRRFCSFGVQIARNKLIMNNPANINSIILKIYLIRSFSSCCTALGVILNVFTKKLAFSGLNTIYARKLPKKIIATRSNDPINFRTVPAVSGSRGFFIDEIAVLLFSVGDHTVIVVHKL